MPRLGYIGFGGARKSKDRKPFLGRRAMWRRQSLKPWQTCVEGPLCWTCILRQRGKVMSTLLFFFLTPRTLFMHISSGPLSSVPEASPDEAHCDLDGQSENA